MERINVRTRKWGDSIAVVIPKVVVDREKIRPNDSVMISLEKENNLSDLFGKLKIKKSAQELKDEERSGWE